MSPNRREFIETAGAAVATVAATGNAHAQSGQSSTAFSIDEAFAVFMRDIGGTPADAGGTVTFTGSDPILRSHFRIGTSMALPAMAAGVGAAAVWKERTGEGQDVHVDLREAVYNVNPLMTPIMQFRIASGSVPADDPVARGFTFMPTINGSYYQAPLGVGNPFSFVPYRTKDGRFMNITGVYPQHHRCLSAPPESSADPVGRRSHPRVDHGCGHEMEWAGTRKRDGRSARRRRDAPYD